MGSILPRFLGFLLVRLHTDKDVFGPVDYGILTKLFGFSAVINVIFLFGMETAYFRFANKKGLDEKSIFDLSQTVVTAISFFSALLLIIFSPQVADLLMVEGYEDLLIMLSVLLFIDAVVAIPFARLRFQKKPARFAILKLTNIAIVVGLNLYFLKLSTVKPEVSYVILANLIANGFYLLFFVPTFISWRPKFDKEISPQMFSYAYPVMLTGLAGMTNDMFSRMTLDYWLPDNFYPDKTKKEALGIFGGVYRFSVLMNLAIQAFRYAAEPFFFSQSAEKNSPHLFARVNHYFTIVCCLLLLGVSINLDIFKYFLGQEVYWEGLHIVPVLLLAYLFLGVYYNFSVWFKLTDKTHFGTLITFGGMFITILGNYFLIPVWGYFGSSIAAAACYFFMMMMCYWLGQKYYPIPYTIVKDLFYILITLFIVYGVNAITFGDAVSAFIFHTVVIIVYISVILLLEWRGLMKKTV